VAHTFFDRLDSMMDLDRRSSWVDQDPGPADGPSAGSPPMDVVETDAAIEIVVDLPGIERQAVTVTYRDGKVLIAGHKRPTRCQHTGRTAFHLAERTFGRFARSVTLGGAFDASRASATLSGGELHIIVPRISERRGQQILIEIRP
jgi:HSP20 family protein